MIVQIGRREEFDKKLLGEMHKLRAQVFKERKGWDVSVIDEMEIDGYDALSPYYMLIQEDTPEAQVFGCWRILDTTGPYMLKNTFPELLHGKEAPCSPHIWELSRFAINSGQKGSLGFSDCTLEAMRALARYSLQNDIQTLVTVTTVGVEKMMIRAGLDVSRFGPHLKIGIERAVALRIELNAKTQIALYGECWWNSDWRFHDGDLSARAGAFSVGEGAPGVDAESAVKRVRPAPDSLSGIAGPGRRAAEQASHGAAQAHFPQYFEFTVGFHLFRDQR